MGEAHALKRGVFRENRPLPKRRVLTGEGESALSLLPRSVLGSTPL
jgi:hypothetical protein